MRSLEGLAEMRRPPPPSPPPPSPANWDGASGGGGGLSEGAIIGVAVSAAVLLVVFKMLARADG